MLKLSNHDNQRRFNSQNLIPILIGIVCFGIVCGLNVLNPWNEQWLFGGGDATQHYLGWLFFRNSPWAWPLGLNLDYGLDLKNSIVFTDSIPLLAIPLKALSAVLPNTFQYFGVWAMLCFVLQAWFSWKLISLFTEDLWIRSICSGLFIFSVPMLSLFPENPALGSLFLILASLYLSLNSSNQYPAWPWFWLLLSTSLIHFYIFVLVGAIWIASLLDGVLIGKFISFTQALRAMIVCIPSVLLATYLAGYFTISSVGAFGYGMFKINLLGLFNPAGWSTFVKAIYVKPHWWSEEPIYLGLGGLLLMLIVLSKIRNSASLTKSAFAGHLFLALTIIALAVFSVSNNIAIGSYEFTFPISEKITALASILRNSGRMFIPAFYALLLLVCYLVIKQFSRKITLLILTSCLILQIIDLSVGWLDVRQRMTSNGPFPYSKLPLENTFWNSAAKQYKNIIVIPSRFNLQPDFMSRFLSNEWRVFGRFASMNQLGTNAVYLARYDEPKSLELNRQYLDKLNTGNLAAENLYIVSPEEVNTAACTSLQFRTDLFAKIDSYFVYAPRYFRNHAGLSPFDQIKPSISKDTSLSTPFALCGTWSKPENWGTWSDGSLVKIYIPIPNPNAKEITISLQAFVNGKHPEQRVEYTTDGRDFKSISLNQFSGNQINVPVNSVMRTDGYALLEFKLLNPVSPKSLGMGDDSRELGIGLTKVEVR
jgi:Family of unknown function (DUF6311)